MSIARKEAADFKYLGVVINNGSHPQENGYELFGVISHHKLTW